METNNLTIEQDMLSVLTGYEKSAEIAAFLAKNKVPFYRGKRGKVCTTLDALNYGLGLSPNRQSCNSGSSNSDEIEVL